MIAIFDIGSNSVRMGLMQGQTARYKKLVTTRLGEGLASTGRLQEDPMRRSIEGVLLLKEAATADGATAFYAYATEAVRKAENGREFAVRFTRETGVPLEILSGETEAEIGFSGAVGKGFGAIVDIGGASTEIAVKTAEISFRKSLPVGCVVLKNTCGEEEEALAAYCLSKAKEYDVLPSNCPLYGIGGTATSLAALDLGLKKYNPTLVTGHAVTVNALTAIIQKLRNTSVETRLQMGVHPGRADLILVGAVWMKTVLQAVGAPAFIASDRDNIEGYAGLLLERSYKKEECL